MPDETRVTLSADLHGFFREEVVLSGRHLGLKLTDSIEYYVVQLLTEFSHREDVADMYRDEPLIVLHQRASSAPVAEQFVIFKQLGDWALYVAGFFAEFIERSLVTLEYYSAMGTAAYRNVAALCSQTHKPGHLQAMYRELAQSFAAVVDVLTHVSHRARQRNGNDIDLLKLYDRYVNTQSERVKKMLEGRGLVVETLGPQRRVSSH